MTLCFDADGPIGWDRFAADVATLRPAIAGADRLCNLATDRYDFMVGLAAAMLNGQVCALPSSAAPEAIAAALNEAETPLLYHERPPGERREYLGDIFTDLKKVKTEIQVFTSGSTGAPTRHVKDWSILTGGAKVTETILRGLDLAPDRCALIGTTPHQHMYGLEAAVFTGLALGYPLYRGRVFYPADLEQAIAHARAAGYDQAALITSPAHLRFFADAIAETPEIRAVVSATAPLPGALAQRLERRGDLAVMEVYGSTETGSLALRRTVEGDFWTPAVGFTLRPDAEAFIAEAPHLPAPHVLGDLIEQQENGRFRLLGRRGDLIEIGGKRASLSAFDIALHETPELSDGVALREARGGRDIIVAIVVRDPFVDEPTARAAIRREFLRRFDPVFAPRRIGFVDRLPRQGAGKIPAAAIEVLRQALEV